MYFRNFPEIRYSLDAGDNNFIITDFFRRVRADQRNIASSLAYDQYDIRENETPEILADKLYNDSALHWIILITNDIIDPRWDWPMDTDVFIKYVTNKYGQSNLNAVHHYENEFGDIVHSSYLGVKTTISNFEHEQNINESKRRIRILKRQFVPAFITNFENVLRNGQ
jgi:hypothetical protein